MHNYAQIGQIVLTEIEGLENESEVNGLIYLESAGSPYLVVGGERGQLAVIDVKKNTAWVEENFVPSEITSITLTKDK